MAIRLIRAGSHEASLGKMPTTRVGRLSMALPPVC